MNPPRKVIDTRPMSLLLLTKSYRYLTFLIVGLVAFFLFKQDPPVGLKVEGYRALILFGIAGFFWITQMLPLAITGLLAIAGPPLLGILQPKQAFKFFGDETVFFILGVFILAAAMMKSGLSSRMALRLLRGAGSSPKKLLFRMMLTATLLSCVISEHAVAAMMFPIALEITAALEFVPYGGSYGRLLFLAMAWGCIVGGIATLLGSGRAPLSVSLLRENTGQSIDFLTWTFATIPIVIFMFGVAYLMMTRYFRIDVESVSEADRILTEKIRKQGKISVTEGFISITFFLTVIFWVLFGTNPAIGMASISILAVVFLFMFKAVRWKDLEQYVNWGVFLMYGGAICLSAVLGTTGAADWLGLQLKGYIGTSPWTMVIAFTLGALILTEAISNSAVVAILTPIAIASSKSLGVDAKGITLLIALASGLGNALPMSTPAMAIAFSSGYFKIQDTIIPALIMSFSSVLALLFTGLYWWPLLGIRIFS